MSRISPETGDVWVSFTWQQLRSCGAASPMDKDAKVISFPDGGRWRGRIGCFHRARTATSLGHRNVVGVKREVDGNEQFTELEQKVVDSDR